MCKSCFLGCHIQWKLVFVFCCMIVCMLSACGSKSQDGDDIALTVANGEWGVFNDRGYYRIKNQQIIYIDENGELNEIYEYPESEIPEMLISRDDQLFSLSREGYQMGENTIFKYYYRKWDTAERKMKDIISIKSEGALLCSVAVTDNDLYYTTAATMGAVKSLTGVSYQDCRLWKCNLKNGKTKQLMELKGSEDMFNNNLLFCESDSMKTGQTLLLYQYSEKDDEKSNKYKSLTEFYSFDVKKNKVIKNENLLLEDGYLKGCQKDRILYYFAENTDRSGYTLNRYDMDTKQQKRIMDVYTMVTGGFFGDYVTGLISIESQKQYLYSCADNQLMISRNGSAGRILAIRGDSIAIDDTDYTGITEQEEDIGTYKIVRSDYIQEKYEKYTREHTEDLTYYDTDETPNGKDETQEALSENYEEGIYSKKGNRVIFTGKDGAEKTIYEAKDGDEIVNVETYLSNMYMIKKETAENHNTHESLIVWKSSDNMMYTLATEKEIVNVAFKNNMLYALFISEENEMYNVMWVDVTEMMGESRAFQDRNVMPDTARLQFSKKIFEDSDPVIVNATLNTANGDSEIHYEIDEDIKRQD